MPCQSGTSTQGQTGQTTESSCGKTNFSTSRINSEEITRKLDLHVFFMFNTFRFVIHRLK